MGWRLEESASEKEEPPLIPRVASDLPLIVSFLEITFFLPIELVFAMQRRVFALLVYVRW